MAGTHQIWLLDLKANVCKVYSGNGREGNSDKNPQKSTWAQPSGITAGLLNERMSFFIADSESSAIRAIDIET